MWLVKVGAIFSGSSPDDVTLILSLSFCAFVFETESFGKVLFLFSFLRTNHPGRFPCRWIPQPKCPLTRRRSGSAVASPGTARQAAGPASPRPRGGSSVDRSSLSSCEAQSTAGQVWTGRRNPRHRGILQRAEVHGLLTPSPLNKTPRPVVALLAIPPRIEAPRVSIRTVGKTEGGLLFGVRFPLFTYTLFVKGGASIQTNGQNPRGGHLFRGGTIWGA